jgi:arylsulfatase A-like enzyme
MMATKTATSSGVFTPATVLPRPIPPYTGKLGVTPAESSKPVYAPAVAAPKGAPNVLLILTDDVGFGTFDAFGGPVPAPTFDGLAAHGLRYNEFHTTALCSPTRAALLTGRNHHSVGTGVIQELATGYPGYTSVIPKSAATIAEVLRQNGYNTAQLGKNHNVPDWQNNPAGPFDNWPNHMGFDYFYGFNSGETNQWAPTLTENLNPVEPPANDPTYLLDRDLADHAVSWLRMQNTQAPDKPFFLYYAPSSGHAPHDAQKDWIAKFHGKFDQGWDKLREETFARQKKMGVIPADAKLRLGQSLARRQKGRLTPDGGRRRRKRLFRLSDRPGDRGAPPGRQARQHHRHLHRGR